MKRRLMIARALMHQPKLLILDEPTAGVDIEIRRSMWQFLREINEAGTTIILTTHYLEEAENLCRHVAIIDHGQIVVRDEMAQVLRKLNAETFVLNLREPLPAAPVLDGYSVERVNEHEIEVEVTREQDLNGVFAALSAAGLHVVSMRNKANRLEELFLRLTARRAAAGGARWRAMNARTQLVALYTLVRKEYSRVFRIWVQTIVPPAITTALYFLIFGNLIGRRIGQMGGYDYAQYIAPGLIMMQVITNAYGNVVSSFFSAKMQRHLEEMLVAPMSNWVIILGHTFGGVVRGLAVAAAVTVVALFFTHLHVAHVLDHRLGDRADGIRLLAGRAHQRHPGEELRRRVHHPVLRAGAAELSRRRLLLDLAAAGIRAEDVAR